jgi:Phosphoserine phosphatase RsbU, N-terminal domain/GAF domain
MSSGANAGTMSFQAAYARAFEDFLREPNERSLSVAYDLGREAVSRRLSVLDLALIHQESLLEAMRRVRGSGETQRVAGAGGDFFLESLSSFEMVQRGYGEAREAALHERRQLEMSRRLSTFLADGSLALDSSDSLEEMLRLVAEQARELVGADCCLATVAIHHQPRTAEAVSYARSDKRWSGFVRWLDLLAIYPIIRASGGSVRLAGAELAQLAPFRTAAREGRLRGWLAASLTALDGGELGAIQLFAEQDGCFTEEDEAALVHLAQMAAAAAERARLYQRDG